jgi:hypothetical protein
LRAKVLIPILGNWLFKKEFLIIKLRGENTQPCTQIQIQEFKKRKGRGGGKRVEENDSVS